MSKRAISITLAIENILWLRAQTRLRGARSVSETVDTLIGEARASSSIRSVVGTIDIDARDPELRGAEAAVLEIFGASLARDRAKKPTYRKKPPLKRAYRKKRRG